MMGRPGALRWVLSVAAGELLGFALTAGIASVALELGGHPTTVPGRVVALLVMTLAGLIEGACYGGAQAWLLLRWLPGLDVRRFVTRTMALAAGAWCFGMSMPLVATLAGAGAEQATRGEEPSTLVVMVFATLFGGAAGALFGVVQAPVLRGLVEPRSAWVLGSSVGWAAGLPWAYLAGGAGSEAMSWWQAGALACGAGLMMGLCAGVGTWAALRRMRPVGA